MIDMELIAGTLLPLIIWGVWVLYKRREFILKYARFSMNYTQKTDDVIDTKDDNGQPIRFSMVSYHLILSKQNDIIFTPVSLRFWTEKTHDCIEIPVTLTDMMKSQRNDSEFDIEILKFQTDGEHERIHEGFLKNGEHEVTYIGYIHDIKKVDEIIWEFTYKSQTETLRIIEYFKKDNFGNYKSQGLNEVYINQWWAHLIVKGSWFLKHKKIIKKWLKETSIGK